MILHRVNKGLRKTGSNCENPGDGTFRYNIEPGAEKPGTCTLAEIPLEGWGKVRSLHLTGLTRRRLLDLGMVPGTMVKVVLQSPAGDPRAYQIRGTLIALRREEAEKIAVTPE